MPCKPELLSVHLCWNEVFRKRKARCLNDWKEADGKVSGKGGEKALHALHFRQPCLESLHIY